MKAQTPTQTGDSPSPIVSRRQDLLNNYTTSLPCFSTHLRGGYDYCNGDSDYSDNSYGSSDDGYDGYDDYDGDDGYGSSDGYDSYEDDSDDSYDADEDDFEYPWRRRY